MADIPSAPVPLVFHERKHAYPHDLEHDHSHHQHHEDHHHRASAKKLPVIPDLRFEHSYLRSVRPYVKVERVTPVGKRKEGSEGTEVSYEKIGGAPSREFSGEGEGKGKEVVRERTRGPSEVITVQWGKVAWATIRDQVISPLLQGLLWALASYYIRPFSRDLGSRMGTFVHETLPRNEGSVVSWLRGWTKSIGLTGMTSSSPSEIVRASK